MNALRLLCLMFPFAVCVSSGSDLSAEIDAAIQRIIVARADHVEGTGPFNPPSEAVSKLESESSADSDSADQRTASIWLALLEVERYRMPIKKEAAPAPVSSAIQKVQAIAKGKTNNWERFIARMIEIGILHKQKRYSEAKIAALRLADDAKDSAVLAEPQLERVFRYWKTDTQNVQARIVQLAMMFSAQNGDIAEAASLGEQVVKMAPEFAEKERVGKQVNQLKQGKNPYRP